MVPGNWFTRVQDTAASRSVREWREVRDVPTVAPLELLSARRSAERAYGGARVRSRRPPTALSFAVNH